MNLQLRPEVVFAFAIEPARGRGAEVVKMGEAVPSPPDLHRSETIEASVGGIFFGLAGENKILFAAGVKSHRDRLFVRKNSLH